MKQGFIPDMRKRGSLRTVLDGRYKFTRNFSPWERNRPTTLDELYRSNDVELFGISTDPGEMVNLAADRTANAVLIQRMSNKLETMIKLEIGVGDGREMPAIPLIKWTIDRVDLKPLSAPGYWEVSVALRRFRKIQDGHWAQSTTTHPFGASSGYITSVAHHKVYINLKSYGEFGAVNRSPGWNLWLTIATKF